MPRKLRLLIGVVVLFAAIVWIATAPIVVRPSALAPFDASAERGRMVFNTGGCASCHAEPKQEDRTRLSGGLALVTPFGTFYAPNISQDAKDGIGAWSEANFVTAMWKGTSPQRTHYFPAFPYPSYQRMPLQDVRDLFAYLKTLPKIAGRSREHDLRFPFGFRPLVGIWKLLFLDGKPFSPDPAQSAEWNRGAYLVNGPGHCGECHTPRNVLGGPIRSQRFAGGPDPEGQGWVPNITAAGLKDWSQRDVEDFLKDGMMPEGGSVSGSMGRVIKNTTELSDADRRAIAVYLKSLPAVEGPRAPAKS